jgi:TPR repeat protein
MDLFESDPFPDRPPHLLRIVGYRYNFTDKATYRATRQFWTRTYLGEFMPMIYIDEQGDFALAETPHDQVLARARYHNPAAQSYLGFLYLSGEEDTPRDTTEAARWFRLAAEQGQVEAQFNLALLLAGGDGVPADPRQAAHWCRRAAEQGFPPAQDHLGQMYYEGHGVPRDKVEALVWFRVAALGGLPEAEAHVRQVQTEVEFMAVLNAEKRAAEIFARIQAQR